MHVPSGASVRFYEVIALDVIGRKIIRIDERVQLNCSVHSPSASLGITKDVFVALSEVFKTAPHEKAKMQIHARVLFRDCSPHFDNSDVSANALCSFHSRIICLDGRR